MKLLALAVLLTTTAAAHADAGDYDTEGDALAKRWRFENTLGFRGGSFHVNNIDMGELQGALGLGVRRGRWTTFAEYSFTELAIPDATSSRGVLNASSGVAHRFSPTARYSYMRFGSPRTALDVYAELGVGLQHIRWDEGGHWTRPDVSFGLGTTTLFNSDRKHWGVTFGMRLTLARRSDVPDNAPIACGGPCDQATKPTGLDRSFMIDTAFHFGT